MADNLTEFVDMRAMHTIGKQMRENLVKDMKKLVDDEIEQEIKRAIKDVPWA